MIAALALSILLAQDPKPPARTVEERLKELADKIEVLDKKAAALSDENAKLQQQVNELKSRREAIARQSGAAWVKRYAAAVELTEQQSAEIEALWVGWTKQDLEKPSDVAHWKSREEILRGKLAADQLPKLARKILEEQRQSGRAMVVTLAQSSKFSADKVGALEKVVLPRLTYDESILLSQAHPEKSQSWPQILAIVEANLSELSAALSTEEMNALRQTLDRWKPKQR
jgi:septal ring factor EnvC (AmiA/AmiB activator)